MNRLVPFLFACLALAGCSKSSDDPQPVVNPSLLVGTWDLTDNVVVTTYSNGLPPSTDVHGVDPGEAEFTYTAAGVLKTVERGTAQRPVAYVYADDKITVTDAAGARTEATVTTLTAERLVFYTQLVGSFDTTTRTLSFKRR